jgi:Putative transposase
MIVKVIETKFNLGATSMDVPLRQWFLDYINHVAVYHALRSAAAKDVGFVERDQTTVRDGERRVTFKVKDYRIDGPGRYATMTLDVGEFIRRFLIHVLPKGFTASAISH